MELHGYASISWICMDEWICIDTHGYAQIDMDMYEYAWSCIDIHGYVSLFIIHG